MKKLAVAVLISLMVAGADAMAAPSLTLVITCNPGGQGSKIEGKGTYALDPGCTYNGTTFSVTVKGSHPPQVTGSQDTTGGGAYDVTLVGIYGTFNPCQASMSWTDANNNPQVTVTRNLMDQVVRQ
ncbi:MAG TPA: hypothetical protein VK395_22460 [Gemmataceae bacterium]|nr:hypothetical protein [Gemmataceae bacterium]